MNVAGIESKVLHLLIGEKCAQLYTMVKEKNISSQELPAQGFPAPPEMSPERIEQIAKEAREWRDKFEQLTKDIEGFDPRDRQIRTH